MEYYQSSLMSVLEEYTVFSIASKRANWVKHFRELSDNLFRKACVQDVYNGIKCYLRTHGYILNATQILSLKLFTESIKLKEKKTFP